MNEYEDRVEYWNFRAGNDTREDWTSLLAGIVTGIALILLVLFIVIMSTPAPNEKVSPEDLCVMNGQCFKYTNGDKTTYFVEVSDSSKIPGLAYYYRNLGSVQ